jgi:hypothetical protein
MILRDLVARKQFRLVQSTCRGKSGNFAIEESSPMLREERQGRDHPDLLLGQESFQNAEEGILGEVLAYKKRDPIESLDVLN